MDDMEKIDVLLQTIRGSWQQDFLQSLLRRIESGKELTEKQRQSLDNFWDRRDHNKLKKMGLE